MTAQRSRFLASLSERLRSDLAAHEENREDLTSAAWPEHTGRPGGDWPEHTGRPGGDEPAPEEIAGARIGRSPPRRAAQVEPEQGHRFPVEPEQGYGYEAGAPADRGAPFAGLVSSDRERASPPSVPWSEAGMPVRLREAIASVRRVSHEMDEAPGDDDATYGRKPFADPPTDHDYPSDDAAAYLEPDDPRENDALREEGQFRFSVHPAYDEPPDDELVPLDAEAALRHEQMRLAHDAAYREPPADHELVLLEDEAVDDDGQTSYEGRAVYEEPPPDDELIADLDDAGYQHARRPFADDAAYQESAPGDQEAREDRWPDNDGEVRDPRAGFWEEPRDRQPLGRGARRRYGLHAAAFAVAIGFVALAGFGLDILSGAGDVVGPLARDTLRAALTEPTPRSNAHEASPAEPERPAEQGELVTMRVAPAPVAAVPGPAVAEEPAPAAAVTNRVLPLPPPPKPVLRTPTPAQAESPDRQPAAAATVDARDKAVSSGRQIAAAVEDAAAAPRETASAGGPFQPLFAKLPASRSAQTRVFVHYSAGVVGAPATAMHLVRHLKAAGYAVEVRAIEFAIPTNSIRYFFDSDRAQAEALRASLEGQLPGEGAVTVMDFTSYQPRPRPGLIEIWLRA